MKKLVLFILIAIPFCLIGQSTEMTPELRNINNPFNSPNCKVKKMTIEEFNESTLKVVNPFEKFELAIKRTSGVSYIDYLFKNNLCAENDLYSAFTKLDAEKKRKLIRSFTFHKSEQVSELARFLRLMERYDEENLDSAFWLKLSIMQRLNGYQQLFENYLENYPAKYKLGVGLGKLTLSLDPKKDVELKMKGYEMFINSNLKYKRIDHRMITHMLIQFLNEPTTRAYGIEKSHEVLNFNKADFKNKHLYWTYLLIDLYDYIPNEDWAKIIEEKEVIKYDEYYGGYRDIRSIIKRYSEIKGMESLAIYEQFFDKEKLSHEEIPHEYYETLVTAFIGIRGILEGNKIRTDDKQKILDLLNEYKVENIVGYLRPPIITIYYLAGISDADFNIKFPEASERQYFNKLKKIKQFDNRTLFDAIGKYNFSLIEDYKASYFETSHVDNSFPYNDIKIRMLLDKFGKGINMEAYLLGKAVPYDKILQDYLNPISAIVPPHKLIYIVEETGEKIDYTFGILTDKFAYTVQSNNDSNYFDSVALRDLINVILFDLNTTMRLIELETVDHSVYHLYAIPDDVLKLYREFELEMKLN